MLIAKEATSTGQVVSGKTFVAAVILKAAGANATLVIDDSTDGSGDNLVALSAPQNDSKVVTFPKPVTFSSGVYATLSGTGAKAYIYVA